MQYERRLTSGPIACCVSARIVGIIVRATPRPVRERNRDAARHSDPDHSANADHSADADHRADACGAISKVDQIQVDERHSCLRRPLVT